MILPKLYFETKKFNYHLSSLASEENYDVRKTTDWKKTNELNKKWY